MNPSHVDRLMRYENVRAALASSSHQRLGELVADARPLSTGIGGTGLLLDVDGTPVFAKRIPVTDVELRAEHLNSTANIFQLPTSCQYGIGGPGFGVWREVAANAITTDWVLNEHRIHEYQRPMPANPLSLFGPGSVVNAGEAAPAGEKMLHPFRQPELPLPVITAELWEARLRCICGIVR